MTKLQARRRLPAPSFAPILSTLKAVIVSLVLGLNAQAQTPADPPPAQPPKPAASAPAPAAAAASAALQTMPRVEVSGPAETDESNRRRQSAAMSVYGREELDRQGDIDVTDVLKRLPGVSMDGGSPRLRGLGGGYTKVLINGEDAPPGFSLDTLAPGDVERIEVVKGATAEFPGVAGTINIVLREPPRSRSREWRGGINYRAVQPGGSQALQWGDRIDGFSFVVPVSVSRSAQGTEYDSDRISRTPAGEIQEQLIHGEDVGRGSNGQIAPRLQWKLNDLDTLTAGAFYQHNKSRSHSQRDFATLQGTPWLTVLDGSQTLGESDVSRANAQWQHKFKEGGKFEIKASWQDTDRTTLGHYESQRADGSRLVMRDSRTEFEESRSLVGGRWNQPLGETHTLVAGIDMEARERYELRRVWDFGIERQDSATGIPFAADIARTAVFMQDEWTIDERWSVLPGVRVEQVRTRSSDGSGPINNLARVTTPVLHLNYRFDPKGRDQIRASVTRSFKLPDLNALVARYVVNGNYERNETNTPIAADRAGNPLLKPELSGGLDLAYEHYPAAGGVFSVGMFFRRIDGLTRQRIALEQNPAPGVVDAPRWVSRPVNLGRATTMGLEMEVKGRGEDWLPWFFKRGRDSGLQMRAAFNLYRSKVEQVEGPDNRLESQPPWLANMGFDYRLPRQYAAWTVGASLVMQPGYRTIQTDRQIAQRAAVRNMDAFVSWRMDRMTQFRLGLSNILAADNVASSRVVDLDGFSAGSTTRRNTLRAINASWVLRF
ncbi:TonB-dependent receptor [Pelomonas sp. SE-A7]|uniref:TonB-dependent receptor plug domain-containing protein n=1 Tax=Pelomonas sp. SE-A7 TaxID=3054953 RepID=UPI00259CC048|nr:TonB-dependent receptor [Pelomonas sp. SE-A7]MDM4765583.1 TonB-dependent receptor [Pelomonas sp. SE-A7]